MPNSIRVNQTDNQSKNNEGVKDNLALSPEVRTVWLGMVAEIRTLIMVNPLG